MSLPRIGHVLQALLALSSREKTGSCESRTKGPHGDVAEATPIDSACAGPGSATPPKKTNHAQLLPSAAHSRTAPGVKTAWASKAPVVPDPPITSPSCRHRAVGSSKRDALSEKCEIWPAAYPSAPEGWCVAYKCQERDTGSHSAVVGSRTSIPGRDASERDALKRGVTNAGSGAADAERPK